MHSKELRLAAKAHITEGPHLSALAGKKQKNMDQLAVQSHNQVVRHA